jgi:cytochrome c556
MALVAALLATSFGAVIAQEQLSGEDAIKARQELMQSNAEIMGTAAELSGAEAITAAQTLVGNFERLPDLFPDDSQQGDTRALPLIWEDRESFDMQVASAHDAANAVLAAAQAGDTAAYAEALGAMGGQCGACHSQFRGD